MVKLYLTELPKEVQERFRYDPAKTTAAASPYQTPLNVAEVLCRSLCCAFSRLAQCLADA